MNAQGGSRNISDFVLTPVLVGGVGCQQLAVPYTMGESGSATRPFWAASGEEKNQRPTGDRTPNRPTHSKFLYRLRYALISINLN